MSPFHNFRHWYEARVRSTGGEAGTTLIELLVSMGIFITVLAMTLLSVVSVTRITSNSTALGGATDTAIQHAQTVEELINGAIPPDKVAGLGDTNDCVYDASSTTATPEYFDHTGTGSGSGVSAQTPFTINGQTGGAVNASDGAGPYSMTFCALASPGATTAYVYNIGINPTGTCLTDGDCTMTVTQYNGSSSNANATGTTILAVPNVWCPFCTGTPSHYPGDVYPTNGVPFQYLSANGTVLNSLSPTYAIPSADLPSSATNDGYFSLQNLNLLHLQLGILASQNPAAVLAAGATPSMTMVDTMPVLADTFAPPTVSSVSPNTGPTAGGTSITITGTGFVAGATVSVGGTACTGVVVVSATSITCSTPVGSAGTVDVIVTDSNGTSASSVNDQYTYTAAAVPSVTLVVDTATGLSNGLPAGGYLATVTGTNFTGATAVAFGANACTSITVASSTSLTCIVPAGVAGTVEVTVTAPGGTSPAVGDEPGDEFNYSTSTCGYGAITEVASKSITAMTVGGADGGNGSNYTSSTVGAGAPGAVVGPGPASGTSFFLTSTDSYTSVAGTLVFYVGCHGGSGTATTAGAGGFGWEAGGAGGLGGSTSGTAQYGGGGGGGSSALLECTGSWTVSTSTGLGSCSVAMTPLVIGSGGGGGGGGTGAGAGGLLNGTTDETNSTYPSGEEIYGGANATGGGGGGAPGLGAGTSGGLSVGAADDDGTTNNATCPTSGTECGEMPGVAGTVQDGMNGGGQGAEPYPTEVTAPDSDGVGGTWGAGGAASNDAYANSGGGGGGGGGYCGGSGATTGGTLTAWGGGSGASWVSGTSFTPLEVYGIGTAGGLANGEVIFTYNGTTYTE
jgi:hypothetical protein